MESMCNIEGRPRKLDKTSKLNESFPLSFGLWALYPLKV